MVAHCQLSNIQVKVLTMKIIHIYNSEYSCRLKEQGREEAHEDERGSTRVMRNAVVPRDSGEFVTASGGYLRRGRVYPGSNPFFR